MKTNNYTLLQAANVVVYDWEGLLSRSVANSHNYGLHHINFIDNPECRLHAYVATADHEIWRYHNYEEGNFTYHPHSSDIVIKPVLGTIYNGLATLGSKSSNKSTELVQAKYFKYSKEPPFIQECKGSYWLLRQEPKSYGPGDWARMTYDEMHCIYINREREAAWFVTNGPTIVDQSFFYSSHSLLLDSRLYKPMTEQILEQSLRMLGLGSFI